MRSDAIRQLAPPKIRAWLEYWDTHPEAPRPFSGLDRCAASATREVPGE